MELAKGEKAKLDSKDRKILEQLQRNARQSIAQLSKNTCLPRDVIVYRIKKLEKEKVIRQHHTMLNPAKLGYPLYVYVMLACYNTKPEEEKRLISYLKGHKQIVYVAKNSGKYDFTIGICAKDYMDFDEIIRHIRQRFTDMIKDLESLPTVQEYKFDWMADLA